MSLLKKLRWELGFAIVIGMAMASAASCKGKDAAPSSSTAASTSGGGSPSASTAPGLPPIVAGTAAGLHEYLTTVDTVRGATFDVTWRPEVVRLDRATVIRSLQGVSPDGQTFQFAAGEPALAQIKPGTVLLVWGIALGRVLTVTPRDSAVLIRTEVAALTDAIDHGHIAWNGPADFSRGVVAPIYTKSDTLKVSMAQPAASPFRLASDVPSASMVAMREDSTPSDQDDSGPPPDSIPVAALDILKGDVSGFEYEVGYLYNQGGLDFEIEASRKESPGDAGDAKKEENAKIKEGLGNSETRKRNAPPPGQGSNPSAQKTAGDALKQSMLADKAWAAAKNDWDRKSQDIPDAVWGALPNLVSGTLWSTAKDQFDLRIKAQGHLDGLDLGGDISISNAKRVASQFHFDNINGLVNFQYVARLGGEHGNWDEHLKASMPVTFNIPILIGGIPLMFQVGVNLFAIPALSTRHATLQGQFHLNFAGNGVVQAGSGNLDATGTYQGNAFMVENGNQGTSLGISALLVSIQFPRLGFGMGLFNTYSIAYIDFVGTGSALTSGAVGMMPCKRYQVNAAIGAGVATQVLGLPSVIGNQLNKKLSWRKQPNLWDYQHIETRPKELNCEFKKVS